ncbi:hypothetical protein JOC37_001710 [Desulfohalotomaculum tongense]|uniref:hypothetical protein n=1 Tax=Desulforadius tongensis TaxID=1216062 RepID=UPI00195D1AE4|nr:hypothetical protein [Desulforadius tongensis]MBM7855317.1 hypothetical protein [Desulforadius tongensis]
MIWYTTLKKVGEKMIKYYTVEETQRSLAYIEELVGQGWMEKWVHNIRDNHGRMHHNNIPPLAVRWLKASDEIGYAQLTGCLNPSEETLRLANLGENLYTLRNTPGFREQIPLIKGDINIFRRLCYRLSVAADYAGQKIKVILQNGTEKHDLLVQAEEKKTVVTTAPLIQNINEIAAVTAAALKSALSKLPNSRGMVYLDLPLPAAFSPQKLLQQVKEQLQINVEVPDSTQVVLSTTFAEKNGAQMGLRRVWYEWN